MSTYAIFPMHPAPAAWTFTQGFLVGQAVFLALALLFIRYVIFSPLEAQDTEGWRRRRDERAKKSLLSNTAVPPPPASLLLSKTGYEMATHPPESTDWVNVLLAQVLQGYRNDLLSTSGEEGARQQFERWLNPPGRQQSWLDPIQVTGVSLGSSFPLLSNARIRPADGQGRVRAEIDIDYADTVSLSISTAVVINFPRPRFAVLPVSIGVELQTFGGTLSVVLHDPKGDRQHLHICLLPDFHLNLKTTSLLGSKAKLQDIPKLEQLLVDRFRQAIQDRYVYPKHIALGLPRIITPKTPKSSPEIGVLDLPALAVDNMARSLGGPSVPLAPGDSASVNGDRHAADTASTQSSDHRPPSAHPEEDDSPLHAPVPLGRPLGSQRQTSLAGGKSVAASSTYAASAPAPSISASSAVRRFQQQGVTAPSVGSVSGHQFPPQFRYRGFAAQQPHLNGGASSIADQLSDD
ncbi:Maintenance of mitochondrial morphology protein 1 [Vanrija pseudolonga]|uniref:Maintenance of mitochondrial morphology protein 1 n=1 Tax=Vanrija pseudolonga TaxID=143232 RepID=A0AAF1BIN0_9TREE|nr:Maintenance of mitochondrial morphology protein 1 [Vanrija pseudolonga]